MKGNVGRRVCEILSRLERIKDADAWDRKRVSRKEARRLEAELDALLGALPVLPS